jgi:hypothetical protein
MVIKIMYLRHLEILKDLFKINYLQYILVQKKL